ncbi:GtrA family protein [Agromyces sp. NPDC058484]|uniref:GtrA family protein n=1 Tax=Agromyces sp. NPDC058484 TaxID=3346524 RepID=UPI003652898E
MRRLLGHSAVRYLIAGGAAFLVDLGLLALFHRVFGWPLWLATGLAFLISFFFTYTVQRLFAFTSRSPHGIAMLKYAALVAFNTAASVLIVASVDLTGAGWVVGKVVATVAMTIWNYFAYRYWVFAADPRESRA